jgi:Na+/H+-dicarboxylate symporter
MPAASAAVIYFIRSAVISRLTEPGQRQLLCALATASSHAIAPPVITAAMEGCGVLLELLGGSGDRRAGTDVVVVCCASDCSSGVGAVVLMGWRQ